MGNGANGWLTAVLTNPVLLAASAALIIVLTTISMRPPTALDESMAGDQFSALGAMAILDELLIESEPHVVGSPLNQEIRGRIERHFQSLTYTPEVQSRFQCNPNFGSCANIENVIAVKPGSDGEHAVLVTAHYDSSWSGPGAADDGAGVASLIEMADLAMQSGPFRNDIIFLATDGEEQGLIGAQAFAEHHPLFSKVKAVINLEARGVTGPSNMFETGEGNRSIIRILSRELERPAANSLAYEVYKRMPNDTDYSVYKNKGVMGLNFAFTNGVALYHSVLDDTDHIDPDSVQHQGQNAWAMVRVLADRNISRLASREDAAYIDIFGRVLWHYPISVATGITMVLTVLILIGIILVYKSEIRFFGLIWAILASASMVVLFAGGSWLLNWPLGQMVDTHPIEHPSPWAARITILSLAAAAIWIGSRLFAHRISVGEGILVVWGLMAALALMLDFRLPAASFLALLPLAAFFLGMLLDIVRKGARDGLVFASVFGFWMATYLAIYFFLQLGAVVSFQYSHIVGAPLILMMLTFAPMWFAQFQEPYPDWKPAVLLIGLVIAAAINHQFLPGYTQDRPRGMNLVYRQALDESEAMVYVESPGNRFDDVYANGMGLVTQSIPATYSTESIPYIESRPLQSRPAIRLDPVGLPQAQVDNIESSEQGRLTFTVTAPPESERLVIAIPRSSGIFQAFVNGELAIDSSIESKRGFTPSALTYPFPGTTPVNFEIAFDGAIPEGFNVISRHRLPAQIAEEYLVSWPVDAQPSFHGHRAEVIAPQAISTD